LTRVAWSAAEGLAVNRASANSPCQVTGGVAMAKVNDDEVLLLWRALATFRAGPRPACKARGKPPRSSCPLYDQCPRWDGPDDYLAVMEETPDKTERRRSAWPCSRIMELLSPDLKRIGPG
jgi:hypothetical protein